VQSYPGMTYDNDLTNYSKAMKSNKIKSPDIKPAVSERRRALIKQGKRCAICKKEVNLIFAKYIRDPDAKVLKLVCSNCAVQGAKKRNS